MSRTAVVFGASGQVGAQLVAWLSGHPEYADVRAVSRSGSIPGCADLPGVTAVKGDALQGEDAERLCSGVDVVFNCVGLPYSSKAWATLWPPITENLLHAAGSAGAVLVVADNMYCFGPEGARRMPLASTDEQFTSYGVKPAIRARIVTRMLEAHRAGTCKVALVRASDFFGPGVTLSMFGDRFFPGLLAGTRIQLLEDPGVLHAATYVPDFARVLAAVAADPGSWGRAWHVPNAPAVTTLELMERIRHLAGLDGPPGYTVVPRLMQSLLAPFIQPLREVREMNFLFSGDYTIDASDTLARFPDCQPTPLDTSLQATVDWYGARAR